MISRANRVMIVAVIWLVIVFICYFFSVARPEIGTKWEQLPPLPGRATSIELTSFGYVHAFTENGNSFMAYLYAWQDEPWAPYDAAIEGLYGEPCEVNITSRFHPPSPPGEPTSRSNADCFASAENQFYVEAVLLENNEVWLWRYLYGGGGDAFAYLIVLAAGGLGVLLLLIGGAMKLYDA